MNGGCFLDVGSDPGIVQAARYPFRRIIGVEISQTLHRIAQENLDRNRQRLRAADRL